MIYLERVSMKVTYLLFLLSLCTGCASMNYTPNVTQLGELTADAGSPSQKADEMSWNDAQDVKVYIGEAPAGLSLEKDKLVATSPDAHVLAVVSAAPSSSGWGFYDYSEDEKWRKPYCWTQAPLVYATLGIWVWLSPTYYPCLIKDDSNSPSAVEERRARIISTLKKAVKAAGGNVLVISELGKTDIITVRGSDGSATGVVQSVEMTGAKGYAVKQN